MPAESRYRVFIIDEAHMVTTQGFNALLKIVEEPPEHLVFIFATTEPDKVLTTIRSRTHHYPFRLIAPTTLRTLLERLCAEEGAVVEPAVLPAGHPGRRWFRAGLAVGARPAAGRCRARRGDVPQRRRAAGGDRCGAAGRGRRRARRRRRRLDVRRGRPGGRGRARPATVRRRPAAAATRPGDHQRGPGRRRQGSDRRPGGPAGLDGRPGGPARHGHPDPAGRGDAHRSGGHARNHVAAAGARVVVRTDAAARRLHR